MAAPVLPDPGERAALAPLRALAEQAFARASGAPLVAGNAVRLLIDAGENYPAWLSAIAGARRHVHFESYIVHDDAVGAAFADALLAAAARGVEVRLVYDWLGAVGTTSRRFWARLRAGGVEVRCFNPPHLSAPFGWLSRDHRKSLSVDGEVAFVTGLCVGQPWAGQPERGLAPWRDTGVELRGPAVADVERAFAELWAMLGPPLPAGAPMPGRPPGAPAGDVSVRVVATVPSTAGILRLDQLVAAVARDRLWLTDAYFAGAGAYVQALRAAAQGGVDVRLLLPGATDIPLLRPLSRAGYRRLLEAGVRIFEWNGPMLHAKTAVADGHWARVGSTNLNVASWLGNCELDVVVEDERFARRMEEQYLADLAGATEVVLDARHRVRGPRGAPAARTRRRPGPAAAGALRLGRALGETFTRRRMLEPVEVRRLLWAGAALIGLALLLAVFPRLLAVPAALLSAWVGLALLYRAARLPHRGRREPP
jgi:cardiolipin synthase